MTTATTTQPIYFFTYNDGDYKSALNYDGSKYYHAPMTFTINGKTFIVSLGEKDHKTVTIHHATQIYIISVDYINEYISLTYIDSENNMIDSCYFTKNDLRIFGNILELTTDEQVSILSNYLAY